MIKILLADDHDLVRLGIKSLLAEVNDVSVIAEVNSGELAVQEAAKVHPDVIMMDVKMPGIGGLEATRRILQHNPTAKVLVVTACGDEPYPSMVLNAGALGYITKTTGVEEMVQAIKSVYQGKRYISSEVAQQLMIKHLNGSEESPFASLSEREMQVLLMITSGQRAPDVADQLFLSPKTVNSYRYRLFEKLGVNSDVELTHLAIRHGLVDTK